MAISCLAWSTPASGLPSTLEAAPADSDGGTAAPVAQQSGLSQIESTYQKISLARSLLNSGDNSKAKSLLDQIPSSLPGLLEAGGL